MDFDIDGIFHCNMRNCNDDLSRKVDEPECREGCAAGPGVSSSSAAAPTTADRKPANASKRRARCRKVAIRAEDNARHQSSQELCRALRDDGIFGQPALPDSSASIPDYPNAHTWQSGVQHVEYYPCDDIALQVGLAQSRALARRTAEVGGLAPVPSEAMQMAAERVELEAPIAKLTKESNDRTAARIAELEAATARLESLYAQTHTVTVDGRVAVDPELTSLDRTDEQQSVVEEQPLGGPAAASPPGDLGDSALANFLAGVGVEFAGKAPAISVALGTADLNDILGLVSTREDLCDLDAAGFKRLHVNKLFKAIVRANDEAQTERDGKIEGPHEEAEEHNNDKEKTAESRATAVVRGPADDGEVSAAAHHGVMCDVCNAVDFIGARYMCRECPNYDLCSECHSEAATFHPGHTWKVIREPLRPRTPPGTDSDEDESEPDAVSDVSYGAEDPFVHKVEDELAREGINLELVPYSSESFWGDITASIAGRLGTSKEHVAATIAHLDAQLQAHIDAESERTPLEALQRAVQGPKEGAHSVKAACKFYAEGFCKDGAECRFSHDAALSVGLRVQLWGLSRSDLNGKTGTLECFDVEKGRWGVDIGDGEGLKAIRAVNLVPFCASGEHGAMDSAGSLSDPPAASSSVSSTPAPQGAASAVPQVPAALLHRIRAQLHRDGVHLEKLKERGWAQLTAGIAKSLGVDPCVILAALNEIKSQD